MLKCLKKIDKKATGLVAAGVLLGTAGVKLLGSKDAKKLYTNCTAAVLRAKDIYAEAQIINEERANEEFVDAEEETADEIQD